MPAAKCSPTTDNARDFSLTLSTLCSRSMKFEASAEVVEAANAEILALRKRNGNTSTDLSHLPKTFVA